MRRLLVRLLANALGLYLAVTLVPGVRWDGSWTTLFIMAVIFGLVNALVRPLLALVTCPVIVLTLGLFTLVINGLMLWLSAAIGGALGLNFFVDGFVPGFWGALVISLVNWVLTLLLGDHRQERR